MAVSVFAIANQKGGVGKTTTAINLGAALAGEKVPTLIIDMDTQGNATSGLGLEKTPGGSLYGPLNGEGDLFEKIRETSVEHLHLIPAEVDLAALEIELSQREDYLIQLRQILLPLHKQTDFRVVLIDCPPSLGITSMNALGAADYLLIALQCEYLALEGLGQILKIVDQLRDAEVNPGLELGGIIMTMFDIRTNLSRQVVDEVRKHFPDKVFESLIPRSIRLSEAPSFGKTIFQYDPVGPGAAAYKELGMEAIRRFSLRSN